MQKHEHFRSRKLLALANGAPCMNCGVEDGTVVGAHSNSSTIGKGLAIKADDLPAFLCLRCHDWYDWRDNTDLDPSRAYNHARAGETESMWLHAFRNSVLWLLKNGKLKVAGRDGRL